MRQLQNVYLTGSADVSSATLTIFNMRCGRDVRAPSELQTLHTGIKYHDRFHHTVCIETRRNYQET